MIWNTKFFAVKKIFYLVAVLHFWTIVVAAQVAPAIESTPLTNKQSVLNNKAFFLFPKAAVNTARGHDIMSPGPNENEETRLLLDNGDMRLVFFAQELYSLSNRPMFLQALNQQDERFGFKKKILTDKDSLLSILSSPSKFDSGQKAILVNSLLVKTQDHSVFRIDAFINPEAYKNRIAYQKLSEKVFSTLTRGNKIINILPRKEVFPILGTGKSFEISLPAGYTVTKDAKHDFQVLKFHKYLSIIDTVWIGLTVYTGNHPSFFYNDYQLKDTDGTKVKGPFLGKEIDWLQFNNTKQGFYLKEQQIPADPIESNLKIHVAMMSNSPSLMVELARIVELMTLKK